jgi:exosortase B
MTTFTQKLPSRISPELALWWPVLFGLLAMYVPTYYNLASTLWKTEEQAHGPLILIVVLYLIWRQRDHLLATAIKARPVLGSLILLFGLLLYVVGRSQDIFMFDIGSQIPVLIGILLITRGVPALKALWFPLFFIVFMIPLPSFIIDVVTGPLKQHVSELAETILYQVGYPIARNGVTLTIGQYQLLVADACSGLNSIFSLSALGLLYLYISQHKSWLRNGIIIATIIPIAFSANVIRVIVITLVTYYFGDEAGQGFVHGFAGIVLFIVALTLIMGVDSLLQYANRLRTSSSKVSGKM